MRVGGVCVGLGVHVVAGYVCTCVNIHASICIGVSVRDHIYKFSKYQLIRVVKLLVILCYFGLPSK